MFLNTEKQIAVTDFSGGSSIIDGILEANGFVRVDGREIPANYTVEKHAYVQVNGCDVRLTALVPDGGTTQWLAGLFDTGAEAQDDEAEQFV